MSELGLSWRLRVIFLYYSSYADRNNYKLLKSQNYRRFLIDSEAVTEQNAFPPFDIAFRKLHPSAITLAQFQELLPAIATLLNPGKTRKDALEMFLRGHIEKLYGEILGQSEFGAEVGLVVGLQVRGASLQLLESAPLRKAFENYVARTAMHQKNQEQTFQQVHTFLNEFELSPKLIYKAFAYLVFLLISQEGGWGLPQFKRLLVCIAELHWRKNEEEAAAQETKVIRLLQIMEVSQGFRKLAEKTVKENAVQLSLLNRPRQDASLRLADSVERSREKYQPDWPRSTRNKAAHQFFSPQGSNNQSEWAAPLREVFVKLCSHGEVGNTKTLKSIKLKKYFSGYGILAPLAHTWLDLAVADVVRSSPSGKVEFPHFMVLLEAAARRLGMPADSLSQYLVEQDEESRVLGSAEKQGEREGGESAFIILQQVQRQLDKIMNHYASGKRSIGFEQLTHLLYEFDLFPAFINKAHLHQLYRKFADNRGDGTLNLFSFLQLLAALSQGIGEELTEEERILFLLQRMQDSNGHRNLLGGQGSNLIGDLRARYAAVYHHSALRHSSQRQQNFAQLIEDYKP